MRGDVLKQSHNFKEFFNDDKDIQQVDLESASQCAARSQTATFALWNLWLQLSNNEFSEVNVPLLYVVMIITFCSCVWADIVTTAATSWNSVSMHVQQLGGRYLLPPVAYMHSASQRVTNILGDCSKHIQSIFIGGSSPLNTIEH